MDVAADGVVDAAGDGAGAAGAMTTGAASPAAGSALCASNGVADSAMAAAIAVMQGRMGVGACFMYD